LPGLPAITDEVTECSLSRCGNGWGEVTSWVIRDRVVPAASPAMSAAH
jgi:hypothetical protein